MTVGACQNSHEGSLEGPIENRVYDRIDCARRVSQPQERFENAFVNLTMPANTGSQVDDEERRPAGDEQREHGSDDLDRFPLRLNADHRFMTKR